MCPIRHTKDLKLYFFGSVTPTRTSPCFHIGSVFGVDLYMDQPKTNLTFNSETPCPAWMVKAPLPLPLPLSCMCACTQLNGNRFLFSSWMASVNMSSHRSAN